VYGFLGGKSVSGTRTANRPNRRINKLRCWRQRFEQATKGEFRQIQASTLRKYRTLTTQLLAFCESRGYAAGAELPCAGVRFELGATRALRRHSPAPRAQTLLRAPLRPSSPRASPRSGLSVLQPAATRRLRTLGFSV
jgi:hypothetical protein